jgi:hypothetical protein
VGRRVGRGKEVDEEALLLAGPTREEEEEEEEEKQTRLGMCGEGPKVSTSLRITSNASS